MKVIIAGSRDFSNYPLLKQRCDYYLQNHKNVTILCGKAKGADTLGEYYGIEKKFKIEYYPAKWDIHGKASGVIRNEEMAKNADALIAFWDGKSKGTEHMINLAKKHNLKVKVIYYGIY